MGPVHVGELLRDGVQAGIPREASPAFGGTRSGEVVARGEGKEGGHRGRDCNRMLLSFPS